MARAPDSLRQAQLAFVAERAFSIAGTRRPGHDRGCLRKAHDAPAQGRLSEWQLPATVGPNVTHSTEAHSLRLIDNHRSDVAQRRDTAGPTGTSTARATRQGLGLRRTGPPSIARSTATGRSVPTRVSCPPSEPPMDSAIPSHSLADAAPCRRQTAVIDHHLSPLGQGPSEPLHLNRPCRRMGRSPAQLYRTAAVGAGPRCPPVCSRATPALPNPAPFGSRAARSRRPGDACAAR